MGKFIAESSGRERMEFIDIIQYFEQLTIYEQRCANAEFIELVFYNRDISEWHKVISSLLGEPRKSQGQVPTQKDLDLTARTGGIRIDQTLFEKEVENGIIIAKFWPWKDDTHTTLRMALLIKP